jgi:hypothetical protein
MGTLPASCFDGLLTARYQVRPWLANRQSLPHRPPLVIGSILTDRGGGGPPEKGRFSGGGIDGGISVFSPHSPGNSADSLSAIWLLTSRRLRTGPREGLRREPGRQSGSRLGTQQRRPGSTPTAHPQPLWSSIAHAAGNSSCAAWSRVRRVRCDRRGECPALMLSLSGGSGRAVRGQGRRADGVCPRGQKVTFDAGRRPGAQHMLE